jgi:mannose-6-phosphate isomerase-like protein (cupin superfamily)
MPGPGKWYVFAGLCIPSKTVDPFNRHTGMPVVGPLPATGDGVSHFPLQLRGLPKFDGPFEAFKLTADRCDVLFASYPAGTVVPPHRHETDNVGVITQGELILLVDGNETRYGPGMWYHVGARETHAARFERETSEIEFWFTVA